MDNHSGASEQSIPLHLVVAEEADVVEPAEGDAVLRP